MSGRSPSEHDDAAMLNARASALFRLGRHAEAMVDWDKALARDPRLVAALIGRGNVLHALGRSEEALAEYDKAIEVVAGLRRRAVQPRDRAE